MMNTQLPFHFAPFEKYSLEYFIVHSGVCEAYQVFNQSVRNLTEDSSRFEMMYLHGPSGAGKRHLALGFSALLEASSVSTFIASIDQNGAMYRDSNGTRSNVTTEEFISCFQEMKAKGGFCCIISDRIPEKNTVNPHLASRFFSGHVVSVRYPQEEELFPVLVSLLERYHLRLSEKQVNKILEMIPGIPCYFEEISDKIYHMIEERGRLTSSMLKEVIHSDQLRIK
jgi:chromosomal replication initiation ATPase DnaA